MDSSLPEQQEAVSRESGGYFFFPAAVSMNDAGLLRRPRTEWSESETDELRQKYQSCYDELQKLVDVADQQAKMAVTKEHAPFIMSPAAVSDFLHGSQDDAVPWKVKVPQRYRVAKRLPGLQPNPSALPDEFLLQCTPAFLIRHPALAFPSYYRVNLSCVPLTVKAEFKAHVLECYRRRTVEAYDIWRGVLQGSQPPHLFQRVPAADNEATLSRTMRRLPEIRPLAGATPASMVKAAWFEALRHETKQDGAVFGQFLHAWSGNDGVIGPCMNVIPVHVRQSQGLTRRQIVQAIQLQHAETASADALGWSDIVSNCTDWPAATEVDSVVLHQNFDRDIEVVSDGIICKKEMPMLSSWAVFPMLLVTHPRESRLDALLLMSSRYRGLRDPVKMLNSFARALELLESHPDETLDSKGL